MSIASRINEMTEHLRNDWDSIDKLGLKAKKLPDEYTQVEYIESNGTRSSGTQYIDTGFIPNQNTRTIIDFTPISSDSSSVFIFGSRIGFNNNAYELYAFGPKFRDGYANTNYGNASSEPFPKSANKRYLFDKNKNHSSMYEDNVQFYDHAFTKQTINLSFNMFLFGANSNGSPSSSNLAKMKLYSCKIYDDDTPIRDFIPCYRNSDNVVGLYDLVNDNFYTNQGTGVFTYGEIQEEIPNKNIKNIAPVLDRFYNQSSDKTDLSENGIVGRTNQETTTGKNLLDKYNNLFQGTFFTATGGDDSIDGSTMLRCCTKKIDISNLSGDITCSGGYFELFAFYDKDNNLISYIQNPTTTIPNGAKNVRVRFYNDTQITVSTLQELDLMVENNSTATPYEPYTGGQPSPSPDYPQEINNLSGDVEYKVRGKNLFDKNNANILKGWFRDATDEMVLNSVSTDRIIAFEGKPNTTYTISKKLSNRFRVDLYNSLLSQDGTYTFNYPIIKNDSGTNITITTTATDYYIYIHVYQSSDGDFQAILNSIQIEYGNSASSYEPYISESFPLSLKSKNLFDKDNTNVLVGYISAGAKIISERNDRMIYIPCKPNTTYSLQKMVQESLSMNRFRVATSETEPTYDMTVNQFYNPGDGKNIEKYIITTNDRANYLIFYCYYALNNTVTFEEILDSIQIEEGSTPTDYEPYYNINLCNISDYKDRIYSQNGKFYLEKKTGKVVFDGRRNWTKSGNTNIDRFVLSGYVDYGDTNCFSNYFANETYSDSNYNKSKIFLNTYSNTKRIIINFNTVGTTSLSDFKTWLSTHNTTVYYPLATPTTTEITQENYPTLYSQLQAIQEFLTKYKINKEFLLDYSSPEIEY